MNQDDTDWKMKLSWLIRRESSSLPLLMTCDTFSAGDKVNGESSEVIEEIENEDNKPFQKHFDLSDDSAESKLPKILPRNIPQIEENVHSQVRQFLFFIWLNLKDSNDHY